MSYKDMNYSYYYNQSQGRTPWRNNLVYTSLINEDKTVFVQHYTTEGDYHQGQNQVVDPKLMDEKFFRELHYLHNMEYRFPDLVPKILEVNIPERKIYLAIDGVDFWQRSLDGDCSFDDVLPDWQEQMIEIVKAHRSLGWWKYSMHPSSYFIVDGKLKSINYFFTYHQDETPVSIKDVESHIYSTRQDEMRKHIAGLGIEWDKPQSFETMNELCWSSFSTNYPADFIERVKCIK